MLLKAHCDMRKQEQRNYIIARELDIPLPHDKSHLPLVSPLFFSLFFPIL